MRDGDRRRQQELAKRRDERLKRLPAVFREQIAALTCCAPAAEDLIDTFPALLIAMVSDFGSSAARAKAFETVINGGSLKAAAEALELPMWLKKMPPEAFRQPIQKLPCEAHFSQKIAHLVPDNTSSSFDWLEQVSSASEVCDSGFALWVAKHCKPIPVSRRKLLFPALAAWAWHAKHCDTVGYRLIDKPWSPKMGLRRATEELMRWRRRTELACLIGDGIECAWLNGGTVDGLTFVALRTLEDFIDESEAMNNCLDQYGDRLDTGLIRIFSIRRDGQRVADIEIGPVTERRGLPTIVQIKGPSNHQVSLDVWQAAQRWLERQPLDKLTPKPGPVRAPDDGIGALWQPYYDWLPQHRRGEFERYVLNRNRRARREHVPLRLLDAPASVDRAGTADY